MTRKIIDLIITISFVVFAYLQLNDPDAMWWVLLYLLVSIVSGLNYFNKLSSRRILSTVLLFGILLIIYSGNFISWVKAGSPNLIDYTEETSNVVEGIREYFGLILSFLVVLMYYIFHPKSKS